MPPDTADPAPTDLTEDPPAGLTTAEAALRLAHDGPNDTATARPSRGRLLREVLTEPMFLLLVACGGVYLVLGDRNEALMLLGFVAVVMASTYAQQRRAERSLDALRDLASPRAQVLRDGRVQRIAGRDLVVGDTVLLSEGDRIPADLALQQAASLEVDESMLTGESAPVTKPPGTAAHAGTLVTRGSGRGVVTATGARCALGRIGQSLQALAPEPTPLQRETRQVVNRIALLGGALAAALATTYALTRGDLLHGLLAGLTLAMAILPEELPVVLTLFLGLGAWRLARARVLVRRMPAVERLGATTVLCVDKTGTLTLNRMALRRLWAPGAAPAVDVATANALAEDLHSLLEFAVLASHRRSFDPMETALVDAGGRLLDGTEHLHRDWTLVDDYPLSPTLLAMSRVWQSPDRQARVIAAKGAPEAIVDLCHLDAATAATIATQVERLAADGLRVLGVAQAEFSTATLPGGQHDFDFRFLGLVGLQDPVRPAVPQAIADCRAAGLRVLMLTGDHPATALSIARQAGLVTAQDRAPALLTGAELAGLDDAALAARLDDTTVFCRVQPEHKLRLVQALQARGEVVAMTGDGVNDAPALKAADIGVAMGARGSDVAREAAALVLLDDDFAGLVTAVRHGRRVHDNLRKAIVFVLAAHVPIVGLSVLPVVFPALLGGAGALLLMPVHILLLQLVIDPACSVVFEAEAAEPDAMRRPPRPATARLFEADVLVRGLAQGIGLLALLAGLHAATLALAADPSMAGGLGHRLGLPAEQVSDPDHATALARTLTFSVLMLANLGLIFVNRAWGPTRWGWSRTRAHATPPNRQFGVIALATLALLAAALTWPAFRALLGFVPLTPPLLGVGLGATGLCVLGFEAVKRLTPQRPGGPVPVPKPATHLASR